VVVKAPIAVPELSVQVNVCSAFVFQREGSNDMDELSIPEPESSGDKASHRTGGKKTRHQKPSDSSASIPSVEKCRRALDSIPKLVALGLLTPPQANSMRASYEALLKDLRREESGTPKAAVDRKGLKDIAEILRKSPELARYFEPILDDDQIKSLLRGETDTGDGD
jgi:hypothetical protein